MTAGNGEGETMETLRTRRRASVSTLMLWCLLGAAATGVGCAYGGVAAMPDGTVLVARNSLLGGLRKIYVCKVNGSTMNCVEGANAP
jgi:hypothetical protein